MHFLTMYFGLDRSNEAEEGEPEDVEDEQEPEGDDLLDSEVSRQHCCKPVWKRSVPTYCTGILAPVPDLKITSVENNKRINYLKNTK